MGAGAHVRTLLGNVVAGSLLSSLRFRFDECKVGQLARWILVVGAAKTCDDSRYETWVPGLGHRCEGRGT